MTEIEIGGHSYRIGRLPAMRQFHIVRRLAPVIEGLSSVEASNVLAGPRDEGGLDQLVRTAAPIVDAIGKMSDEQANYIILNSLRAVERRQPGQLWARVVTERNGEPLLMFEDIDLPVLLQLVWHVLRENLTSFFGTAGQTSTVARFPAA